MFIDNLKEELKRQNITFSKMCKDCKIAVSAKNKWEEGQLPRIDKIITICNYLNVSADKILGINKENIQTITKEEKYILETYKKLKKEEKEIVDLILKRHEEEIAAKPAQGKSSTSNAG